MLSNKVVVVTGGAGLIGREFIKTIVKNDGIAIIADVDEKLGASLKNELLKEVKSGVVEFVKLDITCSRSIEKSIAFLHGKFGRIDALVNNAYPKSKNYGKKFFDINMEDFNEFANLHLGGYFNISQQFIRHFLTQGYGNIVNISSIQGVGAPAFETYEGTDMHSPVEYTVVKHGLLGMTKYVAKMFKKDNIRANAISPGGILDAQPERFLKQYRKRCGMKGMLNPSDLSGALIYLLSDASSCVNGQNVIVDDGFCL